jgi:hypothetical protein
MSFTVNPALSEFIGDINQCTPAQKTARKMAFNYFAGIIDVIMDNNSSVICPSTLKKLALEFGISADYVLLPDDVKKELTDINDRFRSFINTGRTTTFLI